MAAVKTDDYTLSFTTKDNRTVFSTSKQVWEQNGIKLTNEKHNESSDVADYENPARFYKNSKITIEKAGMTKIVFKCEKESYASSLKNSIGTTATVSGSEVTVELNAIDSYEFVLSDGATRLYSITVTAAAESGTEGGGTEGGETGGDTPATTYEVTVSAENATVKVLEGTEYLALDGNKFTTTGEFKIKVVAADGYEIKSVKMGETSLTAVEGEEGVYEGTATANANITVTAEVISSTGGEGETGGTTEPTLVATFDFGENGKASHYDGATIGTSKTYTASTYNLALTSCTSVYGDARDAKGNSCLKLGTSSKTGNFTFTVSNDVTKVIIYVAAYKIKDAKIKVNGKTSTVSSQSEQGSYTAIEVDTSTTKTITFETQSDGYRCMIDKIEYYA